MREKVRVGEKVRKRCLAEAARKGRKPKSPFFCFM